MLTREEQLAAEGWEKKITYDEPRLSEIVEMYREIGYDVHLEPFIAEDSPGCAECMKESPDKYQTIYIREKP